MRRSNRWSIQRFLLISVYIVLLAETFSYPAFICLKRLKSFDELKLSRVSAKSLLLRNVHSLTSSSERLVKASNDNTIHASIRNIFNLSEDKFQLLKLVGGENADMPAYEAILRQCAKEGDHFMAEAVLRQIRSFDLEVTQLSFEYIVRAFLQYATKLLSLQQCDRIRRTSQSDRMSESEQTSNPAAQMNMLAIKKDVKSDSIIQSAVDVDAVDMSIVAAQAVLDAKDIFLDMMRSGYTPDSQLFAALMITLGKAGYPQLAEDVFDKVSMISVDDMGVLEYNALMASFSSADVVDGLERLPIPSFPQQLYHKILPPHSGANSTVEVSNNRRPQLLSKVEEIYKRMLYIGLEPNIRTYEVLYHAMLLSNRRSVANSIWKLYIRIIESQKLTPSSLIFEQVLASIAHDATLAPPNAKLMVNRILSDARRLKSRSLLMNLPPQLMTAAAAVDSSLTRSCYESVLYVYSADAWTSADNMRTLQQIYSAMDRTVSVNIERTHPLMIRTWARYSLDRHRAAASIAASAVSAEDAVAQEASKESAISSMASKQALHFLQSVHNGTSLRLLPLKDADCYSMVARALGCNGFAFLAEKHILQHLLLKEKQFSANYSASAVDTDTIHNTASVLLDRSELWNDILSAYFNSRSVLLEKWIASMRVKYSGTPIDTLAEKGGSSISRNILTNVNRVLEAMNQRNFNSSFDSTTQSLLIALHSSCSDLDYSLLLCQSLRSEGRQPAAFAYLSLITALHRSDQRSIQSDHYLLLSLFEDMCKAHQPHRLIVDKDTTAAIATIAGGELEHIMTAYQLILRAHRSKIGELHFFKSYLRALAAESRSITDPAAIDNSLAKSSCGSAPLLSASDVMRQFNVPEEHAITTSATYSSTVITNADRALEVLKDIRSVNLTADGQCYFYLVSTLEKEAAWRPHVVPNRALEIFQYVIASEMEVSSEFYATVMRIWTRSRRPDAPRTVELIFKTYLALSAKAAAVAVASDTPLPSVANSTATATDRADLGEFPSCTPNLEFFSLLLESWSRSRLPSAANKAEEVFKTMLSAGAVPTAQIYAHVARAWSDRVLMNSAQQQRTSATTSSLQQMKSSRLSSSVHGLPRSGYQRAVREVSSASEVITKRNSTVLSKGDVMQQQEQQLQLQQSSMNPTERTEYYFQLCLDAGLQPHPTMYRCLVNAWCSSATMEALAKLDELLLSITLQVNSNGDSTPVELHPSAYSMIAASWREQALSRASAFLKQAIDAGATGQQLCIPYNLLLAALRCSIATTAVDTRVAECFFRFALAVADAVHLQTVQSFFAANSIAEHTPPKLDIISTNLLIECFMNSNLKPSATFNKCDEVLHLAEVYLGATPSDYTFQLMLKVWTERGCSDVLERALPLFRTLTSTTVQASQGATSGNAAIVRGMSSARSQSYSAFASVLCTIRGSESLALKLIDEMMAAGVIPSRHVFTHMIRAAATHPSDPDLCEAAFKKMLAAGYSPDRASSQLLLTALASSDRADSAERTEVASNLIIKNSANPLAADGFILPLLLQAWGRSSSPSAYQRAETVFDRALQAGIRPTLKMCNILMNVYSNAGLPHRAERVLHGMSEFDLKPDIVSFNTAISAWGKCHYLEAEERAFTLLELAQSSGIKPNIITFTSLLSALRATSSSNSNRSRVDRWRVDGIEATALRAEKVFEQMESAGLKADTAMWNKLISMWCTGRDSAAVPDRERRAQSAFERMLASGCEPNVITFTSMLAMWAESTKHDSASVQIINIFQRMKAMQISSDVVSYSALLSALARSDNPQAPLRASEIFDEMVKVGIAPDAVAWTILIDIWRRSSQPNREIETQKIFDRMRLSGCGPNAVTYTGMLQMWTSSKLPQSKQQLESLVQLLESEYVRLDSYGFKVLVAALLRLYGALKTTAALDRAEQLLVRLVNFDMAPAADAWLAIMTQDKSNYRHQRVLRLFSIMNMCGVAPNKSIYDQVLQALTRRPETNRGLLEHEDIKTDGFYTAKERVRLAMATLQQQLKSEVQPSTKNFNAVLLCISRSMLPESGELSRTVFRWMYQQYLQQQQQRKEQQQQPDQKKQLDQEGKQQQEKDEQQQQQQQHLKVDSDGSSSSTSRNDRMNNTTIDNSGISRNSTAMKETIKSSSRGSHSKKKKSQYSAPTRVNPDGMTVKTLIWSHANCAVTDADCAADDLDAMLTAIVEAAVEFRSSEIKSISGSSSSSGSSTNGSHISSNSSSSSSRVFQRPKHLHHSILDSAALNGMMLLWAQQLDWKEAAARVECSMHLLRPRQEQLQRHSSKLLHCCSKLSASTTSEKHTFSNNNNSKNTRSIGCDDIIDLRILDLEADVYSYKSYFEAWKLILESLTKQQRSAGAKTDTAELDSEYRSFLLQRMYEFSKQLHRNDQLSNRDFANEAERLVTHFATLRQMQQQQRLSDRNEDSSSIISSSVAALKQLQKLLQHPYGIEQVRSKDEYEERAVAMATLATIVTVLRCC